METARSNQRENNVGKESFFVLIALLTMCRQRSLSGRKERVRDCNEVGLAATLFVAVCFLVISLFFIGGANASETWQGVARPGFMAGESDNETDITVDLFLPITGDENSLIFFNPIVRTDDKGSNEQNLGLGGRVFVKDKVILGANLFYDAMRSEYDNEFKQWGVGLEALTENFDLRANYYRPFGDTKKRISAIDTFEFASSSLLQYKGYEEALEGYDVEVGALVPFVSEYMEARAYAGTYNYDSDFIDDNDVSGNRYRMEIRPLRFINLSLEVKNDDVRGTDTFAGGYVEIPFDMEALFSFKNPFVMAKNADTRGSRPLRDRMTEKVTRDRHIVAPESTLLESQNHDGQHHID
ncbi:MAG: inverse autotransporter beta domain-containing protein, partial [Deltaproteobacteria bacterium]|nr:inverse autotransporter beta domain-containing protein [Deltaproteobacteria bacterium]